MKNITVTDLNTQIKTTLTQTNSKALKDFVLRYAKKNAAFRDAALAALHHPTEKTASLHYERLIKRTTKPFIQNGKVHDRFASNYITQLEGLWQDTQSSDNQSHIEFCLALSKQLINTPIDTPDTQILTLLQPIGEQLHQHYTQLQPSEQSILFERLSETFSTSIKIEHSKLLSIPLDLIVAWAYPKPELQQICLTHIDQALKASHKTWQQNRLLERKADMLSHWGRDEDIRALADEHLAIPDFREQLVQVFIQEKDFVTAKAMLYRGIELAEDNQTLIQRWQKHLLTIADKEQDIPIKRELLNEAFLSFENKLPFYSALKETYAAEAWSTQRAPLLKKIDNNLSKADIFAHDQDAEGLFTVLMTAKDDGEKIFRKYSHFLANYKPKEIIEIYKQIIDNTLQVAGKKSYQQAIHDLKNLKALIKNKSDFEQILDNIVDKNKKRPSFIKLINNSFKKSY